MRLLMFQTEAGRRLGVLHGPDQQQVVDLRELAAALDAPAPPGDLLALIDAGEQGLNQVRELLGRVPAGASSLVVRRLGDLTLLPPLDPPRGNVIAMGRNYAAHAREAADLRGREPDPPTLFTMAITSINGPYSEVPIDPEVSDKIDWEVELGVVIGRTGKNIPREQALDHVFGYTVINDVSARDIQRGWGGQFFKGKSLDGSCPSGPWVVTKDEVPDPQNLQLRLRVNGELKQNANTRDMIYAVDAMIAWISVGMTVPAGTLIATGTPEGVGFARKPPEYLKPGDVMETEVEGIGTLRNRMVAAAKAAAV